MNLYLVLSEVNRRKGLGGFTIPVRDLKSRVTVIISDVSDTVNTPIYP